MGGQLDSWSDLSAEQVELLASAEEQRQRAQEREEQQGPGPGGPEKTSGLPGDVDRSEIGDTPDARDNGDAGMAPPDAAPRRDGE